MNITDKQLTRAIYSFWDFQQALSALTFLLEDCDYKEKTNTITLRKYNCYETNLIISMARPFEATRNGTTLSLKVLGIKLTNREKELVRKIMHFRRKIIAHSDEEEMHFRTSTFTVIGDIITPFLQFDEGLCFIQSEVIELESLLHRLQYNIYKFIFKLAQDEPERLNKYKKSASLKSRGSD